MDDLSEKEQLDALRAWWSEYGLWVIAGVVIAVGLLIGFNRYEGNQLESRLAASSLFEELASDVSAGRLEDAKGVMDDLLSNYAETPYATQSMLVMAKLYMDQNRDQDAADVLEQLLARPGDEEIKHVARLRLARIKLYQDAAEAVIPLLDVDDTSAFEPMYAEVRGDAHAALGDIEAAGDAYRLALTDQNQAIDRTLVQMKLNDLPAVAPAAEPAAETPAPATDEVVETAETVAEEPVSADEATE